MERVTFEIQRSGERYSADHGWLKTYHSFSFADYYDPKNSNWGALRVFNDDHIAGGQGFPPHPHRDMEIVTYVLSGQLEHQDSMGNRGVVGAGGVQFMSAGTGVTHSEFNAQKNEPLHLVQMWVLPGRRSAPPSYGQRDFTLEDRRDRWLTVASGQPGIDAPIGLTQDATLRVAAVRRSTLSLTMDEDRFAFLFVADGTLDVNGSELRAGDAVRMHDVRDLAVRGDGEAVLWETGPV